jgi:putative acetyltransferase
MVAIRPATTADLPALIRLWHAAWQAAMPEIDFTARLPWITDRLASLHTTGATLLCATDAADTPLAFLTLAPSGEIDQLATAPHARCQGLASALLAEAKHRHPGGLTLTVNTANQRARRLYAGAGFREVGVGVNPNSGLAVLHLVWP